MEKILAEYDWGSLDFNPNFIGEYKIPPREPKVKDKKEEEEEPKKKSTFSRPLSNNFVAASQTSSPLIFGLEDFDSSLFENPSSSSEMTNLYGLGSHILSRCRYNGNGCGAQEQGIKVPLENNFRDMTFGLGYDPFKGTKAPKRPSISVNVISSSLSLKYHEYIDCDPSCVFSLYFFLSMIP